MILNIIDIKIEQQRTQYCPPQHTSFDFNLVWTISIHIDSLSPIFKKTFKWCISFCWKAKIAKVSN